MERPIKIVLSTAIMGQVWPEQWKEILDHSDQILEEQGINARTGLELVAAFKEPLLSLMVRRLKYLGLSERVEAVHGRVDYDFEAFRGRLNHFPGLKVLEITAYDLFMPLVGETYRAVKHLPKAKLLLHAPTLFQLKEMKGKKPRLWPKRLMIENDEKLSPIPAMQKWGDPLNPVEVYKFAQAQGLAKMVFDTAHFWRVYREESKREGLWQEFVKTANLPDGKAGEKLPIYWHLNRADDQWFRIDKSRKSYKSRHDEWLAKVCEFIGPRVRGGEDQICFEEPSGIWLKLSKAQMGDRRVGLKRAIACLKEYKAL